MQPSYMQHAINLAKQAFAADEVPVGAVIVDSRSGEIIASARNTMQAQQQATAHAEMLAISQASSALKAMRLDHCDLYVTLEPCGMCAAAISHARLRRVYFGAYDPKSGGVEHGPRFFEQSTCHHRPDIYGGIEEAQCRALLTEFFKAKR